MEILKYNDSFKSECVAILNSNVGKYFAHKEIESFVKYLDGPVHHQHFFVVKDHGEIIGCAGYAVEKNSASLSWGLVKRNHHRTGVGSVLLKYRLKSLFLKYDDILLSLITSQHTQGFYEKFGFHSTKIIKDGIDKDIDKVHMEYRAN